MMIVVALAVDASLGGMARIGARQVFPITSLRGTRVCRFRRKQFTVLFRVLTKQFWNNVGFRHQLWNPLIHGGLRQGCRRSDTCALQFLDLQASDIGDLGEMVSFSRRFHNGPPFALAALLAQPLSRTRARARLSHRR